MHLRRFATASLLLTLALVGCGGPGSKNPAKKVDKNAKSSDGSPKSLADVTFTESPRGGDPAVVGCADGQREGFADIAKFPTIAGCLAVWDGTTTLRKGKTSKACGDDLEVCGSAADVCAPGWHVCARDGDYKDLTDRIGPAECKDGAGPGKFVAAISHAPKKDQCPELPGPTTRYPCLKEGWGAEPICCGELCGKGKCKDSVWAGETRISVGQAQGCGAVTSDRNGGVMCCQDKEAPVPPPTDVPAPTDASAPVDGAAPPAGTPPTGPTPDDKPPVDDKKSGDKAEKPAKEEKKAG